MIVRDLIQAMSIAEANLAEVIREHYPHDWREDAISHQLLIRLRHAFSTRFNLLPAPWFPHTSYLEWEVYKLTGKPETTHGDIGVLIRHLMPDQRTIEGVAFLEAKIRARQRSDFPHVSKSQNKRLLSLSPHTHLLLYDYQQVAVQDEYYDLSRSSSSNFYERQALSVTATVTHGPTLPLGLACALNTFDSSLYPFCRSFAYQLFLRFLMLRDLDFSKPATDAVKGYLTRNELPAFVLVINTAGNQATEGFRMNSDVYTPIATDQ